MLSKKKKKFTYQLNPVFRQSGFVCTSFIIKYRVLSLLVKERNRLTPVLPSGQRVYASTRVFTHIR